MSKWMRVQGNNKWVFFPGHAPKDYIIKQKTKNNKDNRNTNIEKLMYVGIMTLTKQIHMFRQQKKFIRNMRGGD